MTRLGTTARRASASAIAASKLLYTDRMRGAQGRRHSDLLFAHLGILFACNQVAELSRNAQLQRHLASLRDFLYWDIEDASSYCPDGLIRLLNCGR